MKNEEEEESPLGMTSGALVWTPSTPLLTKERTREEKAQFQEMQSV
jgi:hypothetical protein